MGIGAISGYGMQDYSWYSPRSNVAEDGGFDAALDALDAADDVSQAALVSGMPEIPDKQYTYARVETVEYSNDIRHDSMGREHSTMKVEMENLHVAAMGFSTRRRTELLGL